MDVKTTFLNGSVVDSRVPSSFFHPLAVKPLFVLDLVRASNEEDFSYSTVPRQFANTIMIIFDKALEDLSRT